MYILRAITHTMPDFKIAVGDTKALFELISIMDRASFVVAWQIQDHPPEHFGWAPLTEWDKGVEKFTEEHLAKRR